MSDLTHQPGPPQLEADLAVLDAYGDAFLDEATRRITRGIPIDLGFFMGVLDRAFPERTAEAQRGYKALMLAPSIEIYHALMRGELVPWNTLDYWQAERFKLKRRITGSRVGLDDFNDIPS
jgi:hypothetical protein